MNGGDFGGEIRFRLGIREAEAEGLPGFWYDV